VDDLQQIHTGIMLSSHLLKQLSPTDACPPHKRV
ncbi:MAG: flagellar transcriptional activator FlhD, partial [Enterobacterales bacterium]|nr:flagellar transcriptional activator FlhD [Enterobacterales bacterium]